PGLSTSGRRQAWQRAPGALPIQRAPLGITSPRPMGPQGASNGMRGSRLAAQLALGLAGLGLLAGAVMVDRGWLDRHVLLPFYLGPGCPLWLADLVRGGLAAGG